MHCPFGNVRAYKVLIKFYLAFLVLILPAFSYAQISQLDRYIQQLEKSENPATVKKQTVQYCSERIESELLKLDPDYNLLLACLKRLKPLDPKRYSNYLPQLTENYRRKSHFSKAAAAQSDEFFKFLRDLSLQISGRDALDVSWATFQSSARIAELASYLIVNMKPEFYPPFFKANEKALLKGGFENARGSIELYCVSLRLIGRANDCVNHLKGYQAKSKVNWLQSSIGSAYLTQGNLSEAKNRILGSTANSSKSCEKSTKMGGWDAFFAAQIFRLESQFSLVATCLDKFIGEEKYESAQFFYNIEMAKVSRFESATLAEKYISSASKFLPKDVNYSFLHLIRDIETLKQLTSKEQSTAYVKLKKIVDEQLKPTSLVEYKNLVSRIHEYVTEGKINSPHEAGFEMLDFILIIKKQKDNAKSVEVSD